MTTTLIDPVAPAVLAEELRADFCVDTFRGLEVLLFTAAEAPQAMREIGRIREKAFRDAGAGRNLDTDLDARDFGEAAYRQLVVWDPDEREIVAAYRFICCGDHDLSGDCPHLRTSDLFSFSPGFRQRCLPHLIELGRSVVNKQAKRAALGFFATWKGLAALLCEYRDILGFYGNFSVYRVLPPDLIDALLGYLETYHGQDAVMLCAHPQLVYQKRAVNSSAPGLSRDDTFAALIQLFRERGERLPSILLSYLGAAPRMQYLGVAIDRDFGDALECAILIRREDLDEKIVQRFLDVYRSTNPVRFQQVRG